jgi:hypothetical protein
VDALGKFIVVDAGAGRGLSCTYERDGSPLPLSPRDFRP